MPLSIMRATALSVFFARFRAALRLPVIILSRMMLMKFASILEALLMAIKRSKKTKMVATNNAYKGYIKKPPFCNMLHALSVCGCLLYTSDAADERSSVDLGGRRIIKKKKN